MKCIWDGRGVNYSVSSPGPDGYQDRTVQEAQVQATMNIQVNATDSATQPGADLQPSSSVAQHIFELIPAISP